MKKKDKILSLSNKLDAIIKKLTQSEKLPPDTTIKIPLSDIQLIYQELDFQ